MKDSKMMMIKNGMTMMMDNMMTLKNGTIVMKDGAVKMTETKLKCLKKVSIDMDGKIGMIKKR